MVFSILQIKGKGQTVSKCAIRVNRPTEKQTHRHKPDERLSLELCGYTDKAKLNMHQSNSSDNGRLAHLDQFSFYGDHDIFDVVHEELCEGGGMDQSEHAHTHSL